MSMYVPAGPEPILGQHRLLGERLEFHRVGTDHQTDDPVPAPHVEAMPLVIVGGVAPFLVAPATHEPALGRFNKYPIRKVCFAMLERGQNGKIVRGLFFSSQNWHL